MLEYKAVRCQILSPINDVSCHFVKDALLLMQRQSAQHDWVFLWVGEFHRANLSGLPEDLVIEDRRHFLALPGFIDLHFHWVQDEVRLMPKESLLDWLKNYTWPYEKKFESVEFSDAKAREFSLYLEKVGTVAGACYGSLHPHTVEHALSFFKGDFILGNALMTHESPEYLTHSEGDALKSVDDLSKSYRHRYALTPRFAPTVSPSLMKEASKLIQKRECFIQSHLSETQTECDYVVGLYRKKYPGFEKTQNYTEIYDRCGLLGPRSIMGHGIYLEDQELKRLAETQTVIAHCPTSNAPVEQQGLGSGLFDFQRAEKFGVRWGLGSDIGGGPYLSMFDVMDSFVKQNQHIKLKNPFLKALNRATNESAKILNLPNLGSLEPGKKATFLLLELDKDLRQIDCPDKLLSMIPNPDRKEVCVETIYAGND